MKKILLYFPFLLIGFISEAADNDSNHDSKYIGQESRVIKSLSLEDIAELERGGGWGLAKTAELNGVPGPAHLLEMKDEIPLNQEQIASITILYERMREQAIEKGKKLIALEIELETHFKERTITKSLLQSLLDSIAKTKAELRFIHLATHLKTPKIISEDQIQQYNLLRGYTNTDPCLNIPEGHNADTWLKHNGCE